MSRPTRCRLGLLLCLAMGLLVALPPAANAELQKIEFDSGSFGVPIDGGGAGKIEFARDPGFRPYRTDVGGRAKSGTSVGDVGRCLDESPDSGNGCEFFQAGTTVRLTETAGEVVVFAGQFNAASGPEWASLTAFDTEGHPVATSGRVAIDTIFRTRLEVKRPLAEEDIASFEVKAWKGPNPGSEVGGDLGIDDLGVSFSGTGKPDFSVTTTRQVVPVIQGESVDVPVHVARLNNSNGPIQLSLTGLPIGVSASVPVVPGTETSATITLTGDPSAPDTHFVPTDAILRGDPSDNQVGFYGPRSTTLSVRVATNFELSSAGHTEDEQIKIPIETPDCAPVDVPLRILRDIAFTKSIALSLQEDEPEDQQEETEQAAEHIAPGDMPRGVSVEVLPGPVVAPGGASAAERVLRFRADPTSRVSRHSVPILLKGKAEQNEPERELRLKLVHVSQKPTMATTTPGSTSGFTPRFAKPGSLVRVHGLGFCPGTTVQVGNERASAPATVVDDRTLEFRVPRYATTGPVTIVGPNHLPNYQTEEPLIVDSVRNTDGFAFANYHFGSLSLGEFTEAFGADELFVKVNPCWPWGDCTVPTGILDPMVAVDWGWMNIGLRDTNGHCFGINLAIERLKDGKASFRKLADSGTGDPHDVYAMSTREGPGDSLNSFLDAMHARQYSDEFLSAWASHDHSFQSQLATLGREFSRSREPMVQIGYRTKVIDPVSKQPMYLTRHHSMLAYNLLETPDKLEILVYDNQQPFLESEDINGPLHIAQVDLSAIKIDKASRTWSFSRPGSEEELTGSIDDGSLWVVPAHTVPDDPSLPGLHTLKEGIVSLAVGSTDGAVRSTKASPGAEFLPIDGAAGGPGAAGTWVSRRPDRPLEASFEGLRPGRYTEAYAAPGFVASTDVRTAKGVRDTFRGADRAIAFDSGVDRPLRVELARESGGTTIGATVDTHASAGGTEEAGIEGGALTYAHDGGATTMSFTLTSVRRNGGPSTFVSGPIAVRAGDRLRAVPLGRAMRRVRLTLRGAHGKTTSRVLRSHGGAPGRLRVAAPKISGKRATLRFTLAGLHGRAVVGAALRLMRGGHVLARKTFALKSSNGARRLAWKLSRSLKRGRYRLAANVRAISTGARGSTVAGGVTGQRAADVTVHR